MDALLRVLRLLPLPQGVLDTSGARLPGRRAHAVLSRAAEPRLCSMSLLVVWFPRPPAWSCAFALWHEGEHSADGAIPPS